MILCVFSFREVANILTDFKIVFFYCKEIVKQQEFYFDIFSHLPEKYSCR